MNKISAKQIVSWIRLVINQLVKEFYQSENIIIPLGALNFFEFLTSSSTTNHHLIWMTIVCSALAKNCLIQPFLRHLYKKTISRYLTSTPMYLSHDQAQALIKQLKNKNHDLTGLVNASHAIFDIILPILFLFIAIYFYWHRQQISSELFVPGLCLIGSLIENFYQLVKVSHEKCKNRQMLIKIQKQFNGAVACINQEWSLSIEHTVIDSYLYFPAKKCPQFPTITKGNVLDCIAVSLSNQGIKIIEKSYHSLIVQPQFLDDHTVQCINQQITVFLNQINQSKSLKKALNYFFPLDKITEITRPNDNQSNFTTQFILQSDLSPNYLPSPLLKYGVFQREKNYLIMTPHKNFTIDWQELNEFREIQPLHSKMKLDIKPAKPEQNLEYSEKMSSKKIKIKTKGGKNLDSKNNFGTPSNPNELTEAIDWPGGYNNKDPDHPIVPFDHPLFYHSQFLLFAIPAEYFPTKKLYHSIKEKIEEAKLATSKKGAQGLQFRFGKAKGYDRKSFSYHVRGKVLGGNGKGNIRLFAYPVQSRDKNGNKVVLHVFKGLDLHAHNGP